MCYIQEIMSYSMSLTCYLQSFIKKDIGQIISIISCLVVILFFDRFAEVGTGSAKQALYVIKKN